MAVRIGKFGMSWLQPAAQAADLLVEAGRAKGAGLAAIGQGLGQGLATFGANRRADKIRAEENAFRQQSREDMLAERAADNARQDRQVGMRETEWKASVLGNLAQQYASEADMLDQAAAASGDPSLLAKAQAKRGDAARYRTALEALVSGKGNGIPEMPPYEGPVSSAMSGASASVPVGAPVAGGGGGMDGPVTRIVDEAFSGGPGFFGPKGSYPAPEGAAPMAPVVEPKAQTGAATGAFGVSYTGDPAADAKLATYVQGRVSDLRGSPAWNKMSVERRNLYERAEIEAVAKSGESQFGLKKQEMAFQNQMQAEDEARKQAQNKARVDAYNEQARKTGQREIVDVSQIGPVTSGEMTDARAEANRAFKEQQAELRRAQQDKMELRRRSWAVEDRDIREGRMNAKDAATMAQRDVAEAGRAVNRAQDQLKALNDSFRANKATKEELTDAANDLADAKDFYDQAVARSKMGAAPQAAGGDAMSKAEAEYNALPLDQRTPENAVRIAEKYGVK